MKDLTRVLDRIDQGDPKAASQLLPLVYDELQRQVVPGLVTAQPGVHARVVIRLAGLEAPQVTGFRTGPVAHRAGACGHARPGPGNRRDGR
ncbi:MAG TPA: ECF-type sigma factor [Gemmataceae bacterium]|nr:ECF-type sigma factor [Gemmataceae bacterium]